jgi:hypothetical protein
MRPHAQWKKPFILKSQSRWLTLTENVSVKTWVKIDRSVFCTFVCSIHFTKGHLKYTGLRRWYPKISISKLSKPKISMTILLNSLDYRIAKRSNAIKIEWPKRSNYLKDRIPILTYNLWLCIVCILKAVGTILRLVLRSC